MGLFSKKVDYDELYRKLSTEKMTVREREKAEKLLDKLEYSGDRRGILWMPLICVQWKNTFNASYYFSKWYYNSGIKYFSQCLSGALYSLASRIDFDTPDHDRFIIPAVNIACCIWKKYGDYSLFGSVAFLWSETGKDQCGNFLWLKRMSDNGDYTVVSKYNESSEYYFGHDLDRYTMGSDCELF